MNITGQTGQISGFKKSMVGFSDFLCFAGRFFRELVRWPFEWREWFGQCYKTGYQSMPLVSITAFIMGIVLTLQSRPSLVEFGAATLLPGMVSFSVIKEIGPVITAVICAGKISSRMGAELGAMRVTEQISAMEVSAINPYKFLVVTRVLATTLMIPLLVIYADAIALLASYVAVNIHDKVSFTRFLDLAMSRFEFMDVLPALIKSIFFGFAIGIVGCYKGFRANEGTTSVGTAANSAVVTASLAIFFLDMLAVQITDLLT